MTILWSHTTSQILVARQAVLFLCHLKGAKDADDPLGQLFSVWQLRDPGSFILCLCCVNLRPPWASATGKGELECCILAPYVSVWN